MAWLRYYAARDGDAPLGPPTNVHLQINKLVYYASLKSPGTISGIMTSYGMKNGINDDTTTACTEGRLQSGTS